MCWAACLFSKSILELLNKVSLGQYNIKYGLCNIQTYEHLMTLSLSWVCSCLNFIEQFSMNYSKFYLLCINTINIDIIFFVRPLSLSYNVGTGGQKFIARPFQPLCIINFFFVFFFYCCLSEF